MQNVAQKLVDELNMELAAKEEDVKTLKGAIQGVNLLYTRLLEAEHQDSDQDNQAKDSSKKSKAKK